MILLFSPYFKDKNIAPTLPIGLLSIASYINKNGKNCKVYDLHGLIEKDIVHILYKEQPGIVGISAQFTPHFNEVLEIATIIKKFDKTIYTVIGGNHASSLKTLPPNIDFIVQGEGEQNFYDLVFSPKLRFCSDELPKIRKPYPLIKDLDELPMIDYSLIDLKKYISYRSPFFMREPCIGIVTSRGCPNNCIYCTVKGVWGNTWRGKSPKRTVDEIEQLVHRGIKEFGFLDDSISINRERLEGICKEIIKRNLDIRWSTPNGIAHWTLDESLLDLMKQAGCYRITLGIESGSLPIRNFIRKKYPLTQAKEIIDYANSIGMWTIATNILGFPNETENNMKATLNFAMWSGVDFATFYVLDVYPTADIAKYEVNLELAKKMQPLFYKKFIKNRILHGWNVIFKIRSFEDFRYVIKLIKAGIRILIKSYYKKNTKALLYD